MFTCNPQHLGMDYFLAEYVDDIEEAKVVFTRNLILDSSDTSKRTTRDLQSRKGGISAAWEGHSPTILLFTIGKGPLMNEGRPVRN